MIWACEHRICIPSPIISHSKLILFALLSDSVPLRLERIINIYTPIFSFDLQRVTEIWVLLAFARCIDKSNETFPILFCFQRQVSLSVGENLPAGAEVGTIAAYDADQAGPIYYYIKSKYLLLKIKKKIFNGNRRLFWDLSQFSAPVTINLAIAG